jgi:hypothetical protein
MKNGKPDEGYGCYFSVLRDPDGKWSNRRLLWDGSPDAAFDQTSAIPGQRVGSCS